MIAPGMGGVFGLIIPSQKIRPSSRIISGIFSVCSSDCKERARDPVFGYERLSKKPFNQKHAFAFRVVCAAISSADTPLTCATSLKVTWTWTGLAANS
jgi:hypothetical protein